MSLHHIPARATDPLPSRLAAEELIESGTRQGARDAALAGLHELLLIQPDATAREIAECGARLRPQFEPETIRKRISELVRAGKLRINNTRKCSFTHKTAATYQPSGD